MNKRNIAPLLMVIFSVMAIVPESAPLVHAQGTPTVAVTPQFNAADTGASFTVSVTLDGVANLIGYDVILTYNNVALSGTAVNCFGSGTLFGGAPFGTVFPVTQAIDNTAGTVECAGALLGGTTVDATFGGTLFTITFTALGPFPSDLTLVSPQIVSLVNGGAVTVPVTTVNGTFLAPPVLLFVSPNASATPNSVKIHKSHTVTLQAFIMLSPNAPFAGFGGVVFTVVAPGGATATVPSTINFMPIGGSTTVTASFNYVTAFGAHTGTYHVFATLQRCATPDQCVAGASVAGLSFLVKH